MIAKTLVDLFLGMLRVAFEGFEIVGLPYQVINTLSTITVYGIWIVGADILGIFVSMIIGWWTVKLVVGLVVWIWELLPLT